MMIWVNIGPGNGVLPKDTKPLTEPMLTQDYWHTAKSNFAKNMHDLLVKISIQNIFYYFFKDLPGNNELRQCYNHYFLKSHWNQ